MPVLLNWHKYYAHIFDNKKLNCIKGGKACNGIKLTQNLHENPPVCSKVIAGQYMDMIS
jgi:hypothetical protein